MTNERKRLYPLNAMQWEMYEEWTEDASMTQFNLLVCVDVPRERCDAQRAREACQAVLGGQRYMHAHLVMQDGEPMVCEDWDMPNRVRYYEMSDEAWEQGKPDFTKPYDLISLYAGKNPHGENYTRELADKKGTVEVTTGLEGAFYQVSFAVDGIPPFALNLAEGSGGGNYLGIYHSCSVCGFKWISTLNRCPREGNDTYHPKKP